MLTPSCREMFPLNDIGQEVRQWKETTTYDFGFENEEGVELLEFRRPPKNLLGYVELPRKTIWIPWTNEYSTLVDCEDNTREFEPEEESFGPQKLRRSERAHEYP